MAREISDLWSDSRVRRTRRSGLCIRFIPIDSAQKWTSGPFPGMPICDEHVIPLRGANHPQKRVPHVKYPATPLRTDMWEPHIWERPWSRNGRKAALSYSFPPCSRTSLVTVTTSGSSSKAARGASCASTSPRFIRCSTGSSIAVGFRGAGSKDPINRRRRRDYRLTTQGQKTLAQQLQSWQEFVGAVRRITGVEHA